MKRRTLGRQGFEVSAEGLGCMGMNSVYGGADEEGGLDTIGRALELGVTFLDTAEVYGPHVNEELVGRAIAGRRDRFEIATKFGVGFNPETYEIKLDGSPESVKRSCEGSLKRLGTDYIDLYYVHRIDVDVPIEETVGAMAELVEAGKVRYIGLSEAAPETIRRAHAAYPLTAVQSEYSLWTRDLEAGVIPTLRELGIGFVPFSPLGRGFLTGQIRSFDDLPDDDFRRGLPRFQQDALRQNMRLADRVSALARGRGVTPAQLALAWVMAQGEDIVPIPGTKRRAYLEENVAASEVQLSADDLRALDEASKAEVPVGERFGETDMEMLGR